MGEEADDFVREAYTLSSKMFGGTSKAEQACALYIKAANEYKISKRWSDAGKSFIEASKLQAQRLKKKHEAARNYTEAANCYRKEDIGTAIKCLESANEIYTDIGKLNFVGKNDITIGELCESKEHQDVKMAIFHCRRAAEYFKREHSISLSNKCYLKVAWYCAEVKRYSEAWKLYEEVAAESLNNSLTKYSAREYLLRAGLCKMCAMFPLYLQQKDVDTYIETCPYLEGSKEENFLRQMVVALNDRSVELFTVAVDQYNRSVRFDQWYKTLLTRLLDMAFPKQNLLSSGGGGGGCESGGYGGWWLFSWFKRSSNTSTTSTKNKKLDVMEDKNVNIVEEKVGIRERIKIETSPTLGIRTSGDTISKPAFKPVKMSFGPSVNTFGEEVFGEVSSNPFVDDKVNTNPFEDEAGETSKNPFDDVEDEISANISQSCDDKVEKQEVGSNPFMDDELR